MTPAQALGEMLKLSSVTSRGWKFDLWLKAIYSFKYFHKKSRRNEITSSVFQPRIWKKGRTSSQRKI